MGMGLNIIALLFIISAVYYMMGYGNNMISSFSNLTGIDYTTGQITGGGNVWTKFLLLLGGSAVIIGTIFFPNPYTLFAGIATFLLLLVPSVYDAIASSGLPTPIMSAITLIFGGMFMFSVIVFLKGGEW